MFHVRNLALSGGAAVSRYANENDIFISDINGIEGDRILVRAGETINLEAKFSKQKISQSQSLREALLSGTLEASSSFAGVLSPQGSLSYLDGAHGRSITTGDNAGGQTFTSAITLNFNDTISASDPTLYTFSNGTITVAESGTYQVNVEVTINNTTGSRTSSRIWLEVNDVERANSRAYGYHRNASQGENTVVTTQVLELDTNDTVRVRATRDSGAGTLQTVSNGSRLTIRKLN